MDTSSLQFTLNNLGQGIMAFYNSPAFLFLKMLIGIYVLIVLADIILLIIQRGPAANYRKMRYGEDMPSDLVSKRDKTKERWEKIKKRLESDNVSAYKVAIIEADAMIDELLKKMGYKGATMGERLANIPEGQVAELAEIKEAHEIRNRVIHEEDFKVDRELAHEVLKKYAHILHHFEVLD